MFTKFAIRRILSLAFVSTSLTGLSSPRARTAPSRAPSPIPAGPRSLARPSMSLRRPASPATSPPMQRALLRHQSQRRPLQRQYLRQRLRQQVRMTSSSPSAPSASWTSPSPSPPAKSPSTSKPRPTRSTRPTPPSRAWSTASRPATFPSTAATGPRLATLNSGVSQILTQYAGAATATTRLSRGLGAQLTIGGNRPQQNSYRLDGVNINDYANGGPGSVSGSPSASTPCRSSPSSPPTRPPSTAACPAGSSTPSPVPAPTPFTARSTTSSATAPSTPAATSIPSAAASPPSAATSSAPPSAAPSSRRRPSSSSTMKASARPRASPSSPPCSRPTRAPASSPATAPARRPATFLAPPHPLPPAPTTDSSSSPSTPPSCPIWLSTHPQRHHQRQHWHLQLQHHAEGQRGLLHHPPRPQLLPEGFPPRHPALRHRLPRLRRRYRHPLRGSHLAPHHRLARRGPHLHRRASPTRSVSATTVPSPIAPNQKAVLNPAVNNPALSYYTGRSVGQLIVSGLTTVQGGSGSVGTNAFHYNSYQLYDDASYVIGKHSITFGGGIEYDQNNTLGGVLPNGEWNFGSINNFLTNVPTFFEGGLPAPPSSPTTSARPSTPPTSRTASSSATTSLPTSASATRWPPTPPRPRTASARFPPPPHPPRSLSKSFFTNNPTSKNFEPRIGVSWDPYHNGKTVFSAASGLYDILPLNYLLQLQIISSAPSYEEGRVTTPAPASVSSHHAVLHRTTPLLRNLHTAARRPVATSSRATSASSSR